MSRLCDSLVYAADDPRNRCPKGPTRDAFRVDRLWCARCQGSTPHGRPVTPTVFAARLRDIRGWLDQAERDYPDAYDLAVDPLRRPEPGAAHTGGWSDSTGDAVADDRRQTVRANVIVASQLAVRAHRALRDMDAAIGDALYSADPPTPTEARNGHWTDHKPITVDTDPADIPATRTDLVKQLRYLRKRAANGER